MTMLSGCSSAAKYDSTVISSMRSWKITETATQTRHAHSGTDLALESYAGNIDWTGTVEGIAIEPPIWPGTDFTFIGSLDGTEGVTGPARCTGIQVVVDYETATPVMWTANIAQQAGALVRGAAVAADTSDTIPVVPKSYSAATIQTNTDFVTPSYADLPDCTKFTLNVTENAGTYTSSDTGLYVGRTCGNLDITCTIEGLVNSAQDYYDDWPDMNEVVDLKAFVNQTQFWHIKWLRAAGLDPGAAIDDNVLRFSIPMNFVTTQDVSGTATKGELITPGLTSRWP